MQMTASKFTTPVQQQNILRNYQIYFHTRKQSTENRNRIIKLLHFYIIYMMMM